MNQLRSKGERLSYVDGYNNCYKLFCEYLRERSVGDAVEKMTAVVNLINESVGKGKDDGRWARDSEIIRCKDCQHLSEDRIAPDWHRICRKYGAGKSDDGYCDDGERKEERSEE